MKTFPGWRTAGQAMRWARTRGAGVAVTEVGGVRDYRWHHAGSTVDLVTYAGHGSVSLNAEHPIAGRLSLATGDPATVLGALCALALLPSRFSPDFNTGRLAGQVELVQDQTDVRATPDADSAAPHGPDEPCTCTGCWACSGELIGCTCDIDWDRLYEETRRD